MNNELDNNFTSANYDLLMQKQIDEILKGDHKPTLLLHSCCAPCSTYVLKRLQNYFEITILFYNPNIYPKEEYSNRYKDQIKLIGILNNEYDIEKQNGYNHAVFHATPIKIKEIEFNMQDFYYIAKGKENIAEGGSRCFDCYYLRIEKTAFIAKQEGFDYFCTTLSVSPYKNVNWINNIGQIVANKYQVAFLTSDFKKNDGYKKSIEYSKKYQLYRQDYCGCEYSFNARQLAKKNK